MSHVRTRKSGAFVPSSCLQTVTGPDGSSTNLSSFPYRAGREDGCTDTVVDKYFTRKNRGEIFNNPFHKWYEERTPCSANVVQRLPDGRVYRYQGDYLGHRYPTLDNGFDWSINVDDLVKEATIKCINRTAQSDAMLVVAIAEAHKSIDMITNRVRQIVKLYREVQKRYRNSRKGKKTKGKYQPDFASLWLEYRYGWMPLYLDCVGAYKALTKEYTPRNTARGFARDEHHEIRNWTDNVWGNGNGGMPWLMQDEVTEIVSVRAYRLYKIDNDSFRRHALGLTSPLEDAWELIPWSFVVDWFVQVGDWLNAITPKIGIEVLAEGVVIEQTFYGTRLLEKALNYGNAVVSGYDGLSSSLKGYHKRRIPGLKVPFVPQTHTRLNVQRAIDAISLLKQQIKKR